jgi:Tol biopolymer transport system component
MTMDDLRRRFRSLDALVAPDLGAEIERRLPPGRLDPVVAGRTSLRRPFRPLSALLVTALLLVALVAALLMGAGRWLRSTVTVPSAAPRAGLIAYTVCDRFEPTDPSGCAGDPRIWVMDFDGTGARELRPGEPGSQTLLGWSPDGSRLLYRSDALGDDFGLTDATGTEPERLSLRALCPAEAPTCRVSTGQVAFSPDGSRLAYAIFTGTEDPGDGTIAVFELATGRVTVLTASRIAGPRQCCDGYYTPSWSADGTRLAFAMPPLTSFTIAADGSDLRALGSLAARVGTEPRWSPDGSRIATVECGDPTIYVSRPDGSDIRSFNADACEFHWTLDGRLAVTRPYLRSAGDPPPGTWILDPESGGLERVDDTVAALTAAGCLVCPLPAGDGRVIGDGFWQPAALEP